MLIDKKEDNRTAPPSIYPPIYKWEKSKEMSPKRLKKGWESV
jgi:hypothetical protein